MNVRVLPDLSRVVVIGTSCSGKSTFARDLEKRLGNRYFELDAIHWLPGWQARDPDEFKQLVIKEAAGGNWVTEGQYSAVRRHLFQRATTIVWLNYPFALVLWRAVKRTVCRAFTGQKVCGDNRESIRLAFFSRHSMILWVITSFRRRRRDYRALFDGDAEAHDVINAAKIELTSPLETAGLLDEINASVKGPI